MKLSKTTPRRRGLTGRIDSPISRMVESCVPEGLNPFGNADQTLERVRQQGLERPHHAVCQCRLDQRRDQRRDGRGSGSLGRAEDSSMRRSIRSGCRSPNSTIEGPPAENPIATTRSMPRCGATPRRHRTVGVAFDGRLEPKYPNRERRDGECAVAVIGAGHPQRLDVTAEDAMTHEHRLARSLGGVFDGGPRGQECQGANRSNPCPCGLDLLCVCLRLSYLRVLATLPEIRGG